MHRKILALIAINLIFIGKVFAISGVTEPAPPVGNYDFVRSVIGMSFVSTSHIKPDGLIQLDDASCGFTLINKKFVLIALHCLATDGYDINSPAKYNFTLDKLALILPLNSSNLYFENEYFAKGLPYSKVSDHFQPSGVILDVASYGIKHILIPDKNTVGIYPDFAVIELNVPYNSAADVSLLSDGPHHNPFVYGWSQDYNAKRQMKDYNDILPGYLRYKSASGLEYTIDNYEIDVKNISCKADSGSPLLYEINNTNYEILGVLVRKMDNSY